MSTDTNANPNNTGTEKSGLDKLLSGLPKEAQSIINLINQPAVANTVLGLVLTKVLSPEQTKQQLNTVIEQQKEIISILQSFVIRFEKLEYRISKLKKKTKDYTAPENLQGKATKQTYKRSPEQKGNSYLD
jgi:hypothetical protein